MIGTSSPLTSFFINQLRCFIHALPASGSDLAGGRRRPFPSRLSSAAASYRDAASEWLGKYRHSVPFLIHCPYDWGTRTVTARNRPAVCLRRDVLHRWWPLGGVAGVGVGSNGANLLAGRKPDRSRDKNPRWQTSVRALSQGQRRSPERKAYSHHHAQSAKEGRCPRRITGQETSPAVLHRRYLSSRDGHDRRRTNRASAASGPAGLSFLILPRRAARGIPKR
jgi:hypothetical protein